MYLCICMHLFAGYSFYCIASSIITVVLSFLFLMLQQNDLQKLKAFAQGHIASY